MTQQSAPISCAEFQEHLPELFATANGNVDDPILKAHLDTCENCSALVRDLQYIAEQARMLLEPAEEEPSDAVWSNIKNKLKSGNDEESFQAAPPLTTKLPLATTKPPGYTYPQDETELPDRHLL